MISPTTTSGSGTTILPVIAEPAIRPTHPSCQSATPPPKGIFGASTPPFFRRMFHVRERSGRSRKTGQSTHTPSCSGLRSRPPPTFFLPGVLKPHHSCQSAPPPSKGTLVAPSPPFTAHVSRRGPVFCEAPDRHMRGGLPVVVMRSDHTPTLS